jgi:hypothetical protein
MSPAQLREWRDRLIQARMNGIREVQDSNNERIAYRSDSELAAAIASADALITALEDGPRAKTILFRTSKGL